MNAYHLRQCAKYEKQLEEGMRCIPSLAHTRHLTSVMGVLLQTTHYLWTSSLSSSSSSSSSEAKNPTTRTIESDYEDVRLLRHLVNEMYRLASDSSEAEDAYLKEWHRFIHLARQVIREMKTVEIEKIEEIEEIEEV